MTTRTAKATRNIETLRSIVEHHQHAKINLTDGPSVDVDATTANVLVRVHDALGPDAQVKFQSLLQTHRGLLRLIDFAWAQVK